MQVHNLSVIPSIVNQFIAELRDVNIQKDRMRFRHNLERIGEILAYELSKTLPFHAVPVETPLGTAIVDMPIEEPVIACILRAGLPLQKGIMNVFDRSDMAFVSAYRKHNADESFEICVQYLACPDIKDRVLIMADPMLATGQSAVKAVEFLLAYGQPKAIYVVSAIASQQGIEYIQQHLPQASIWVGAIDPDLSHKSYIIPGLGDAGDLAFGEKMQR
jgi:uracil phosphoribosyltransferase